MRDLTSEELEEYERPYGAGGKGYGGHKGDNLSAADPSAVLPAGKSASRRKMVRGGVLALLLFATATGAVHLTEYGKFADGELARSALAAVDSVNQRAAVVAVTGDAGSGTSEPEKRLPVSVLTPEQLALIPGQLSLALDKGQSSRSQEQPNGLDGERAEAAGAQASAAPRTAELAGLVPSPAIPPNGSIKLQQVRFSAGTASPVSADKRKLVATAKMIKDFVRQNEAAFIRILPMASRPRIRTRTGEPCCAGRWQLPSSWPTRGCRAIRCGFQ